MGEYSMKLDDRTNLYVTLCLYANIENAAEVRKKIMSGELDCCVLKAGLIADPFQVTVAANKAALNYVNNKLTTKTIYTETLFCLSMSKNISQSLLEFGIHDDEKNVIVTLIHEVNKEKATMQLIDNTIKGEKLPISRLMDFRDIQRIKKIYKINDEELKVSDLTDSIISRISIKDIK